MWSGLAAGLSIGFSFLVEAMLRAALPPTDWRPLVAKLGYAAGFIIVILGRQQLFTENTLTPILPLLEKKDRPTLLQVGRLWLIVFVANSIGAMLFAGLMALTALLEPNVHATCRDIARDMVAASAGTHFVRAIFAGWLIALVVWLLPFAESARVLVIIIITYVIGLGHFDHIVAGSVTIFFASLDGFASLGEILRWWAPTLLGNIVGGVLLVAALNHAQVTAGGGAWTSNLILQRPSVILRV